MGNKNLNDDNTIYTCDWCGHLWLLMSDKNTTTEQVNEWFKTVQNEHMIICSFYRILNGEIE